MSPTALPKWVTPVLLTLAALALVPFACIARARTTKSTLPRVHPILNMDNQGRYESQQINPWYADTRSMRPPVDGTIARGQLRLDQHFYRGTVGESYADSYPAQVALTRALLERGRRQYDIFCAPCHGLSGYGDGMVARRADRLQQGTWVPPASLHIEPQTTRPLGHLYNTIANGIRTMPAYGSQIPVEDRWAIVAYIKALQRSQQAKLEDVPPDRRSQLR